MADTSTPDPLCFLDCYVTHAFQWQNGVTTDRGVLAGGPISFAIWISASGLIAGVSQNGQIDPLIPGFPELRAVLWQNGGITDLGTLPEGGYESYTSAVNSRGQVVGFAANTIPDPNAMLPLGYQTRAFLWDRQKGMQDLGTLPGGTNAEAGLINERGQVVGWSYTSSAPSAFCGLGYGFPLTTGSFIWDKENGMKDLGSLGGTCTVANDLNNQGQVVGQSTLTGDQASHAFVWDPEAGLTDLGLLGGDFASAFTINDHGEAVGGSYLPGGVFQVDAVLWRKSGGKWQKTDLGTVDGANCSYGISINASGQVAGDSGADCNTLAFLWEDGGPMVDLNTLVSSSSGIHVAEAVNINDRGEIAVTGVDVDGNGHAVLRIPCDENHADVEGCDYDLVEPVTGAPVRPAQITPTPAAGPAKLSPAEMMTRFRSLRAGRNRRFGTPQTSPQ